MGIMSRFDNNNHEKLMDEPWVSSVVEQLSQPLDASVAAQLRAARLSALDRSRSRSRVPLVFLWGIPTLASVFAIVLSINFWQKTDTDIPLLQTADNVVMEDLSIIKSSDDLEFYQNIEFLLWMEQADNGLIKG